MRIAFYYLLAAALAWHAPGPVMIVPVRFAGSLALDGRADEAAWQTVAPVRVDHGDVRVAFDDRHIYVAITATAPGTVVLRIDGKSYTIASDGTRGDPMDMDTGGKPVDIDSDWLAAVLSNRPGWSAELKIPARYTSNTSLSVEFLPLR